MILRVLFTIIGVLGAVSSVVAGLYMGFWWAFVGGIVQVVEQIKSPVMDSLSIATGIAKVMFAAPIGWLSFLLGAFFSGIFIHLGDS